MTARSRANGALAEAAILRLAAASLAESVELINGTPWSFLISLGQFNARVIMLYDLVVLNAHFSEAESPVLAHADAVAPASAGKCVARYRTSGIILVYNK